MIRINKFYVKNKNDNWYHLPWYSRESCWVLVAFLFSFVAYFFEPSNFWIVIRFVIVAFGLLSMVWLVVKSGGVRKAIIALRLESCIANTWVIEETKSVHPDMIQVPWVNVILEDKKIKIIMAKLPGMLDSDLDKLRQMINSVLSSRYKAYAVTSSKIADNGTYFEFHLSPQGQNKAFVPTLLTDFARGPYELILQLGLVVNLADAPHIAVWGASGTGKTTVLLSIVAQCLANDVDLRLIDGKMEFSSLAKFYPKNKIVSDSQDVLNMLANICEKEIPKREKQVANAVGDNGYEGFGLRGYDIGLQPIVIVADELGSIVAGFDSKQKKLFNGYLTQIAQKGRSISVFLVVASQSPATDVMSQGVRAQFATKILLGNANSDVQRMALGQTIDHGSVEQFSGYFVSIEDKDSLVQPQRYYVPDLRVQGMDTVGKFEKLYHKPLIY